MISVVSPVYNEAENLEELYNRVTKVFKDMKEEFELVLVDNGSTDNSLDVIKELRKTDKCVKYIRLSRNFGHQGGIMAGLAHAKGNAIITIDADLQHPPEIIPELIKQWKKGHEVVYTTKKMESIKKNLQYYQNRVFYKLINTISNMNLSYGQSDYRLIDRKVADVLLKIPETNKFIRGLVNWVGFSQTGVEYSVLPRKKGKSKFFFSDYVKFAFDGIFSFSTIPLRLFLWVGIIVALSCIAWGLYYVVMGSINYFFLNGKLLPPGSATITISILFIGGVQLIGIGCLGEYIGRIYSQTKERPDFIVKEKSD